MATKALRRDPDPTIEKLELHHLRASLQCGFNDFKRGPVYGMAFASFYVFCGIILTAMGADIFTWTLVLSLGFPLVAPFAGVGFYEISRRLEQDVPLTWRGVAGVIWRERGRQIPWMGAVLMCIFLFWSAFAHMSLALFLGKMSLENVLSSARLFDSFQGLALISFEVITGGLTALLTFSLTVTALPHMLDKEVDFVTAMLISLRTTLRNKTILLMWAAIIATIIFAAMIPYFLGLLVALPILGQATWHLYRAALSFPS